jgi:hypothetical protein
MVGYDAHFDVRQQSVGEADQRLVLVLVAVVLEDGGGDGQPQQRGGSPWRAAAIA